MNKSNRISKILFFPFRFSKKYSILLLVSGLLYAIFFNLSVYCLSLTIDKFNIAIFDFFATIVLLSAYLLCMGVMFLISNLQNYFEQNYTALTYMNAKKIYTLKNIA